MTRIKVAVLMGGTSAERDVSLSTGRQILNALDPDKYTVYALDTASGQKFLPAGITQPWRCSEPPAAGRRSRPCRSCRWRRKSRTSCLSPCMGGAAKTVRCRGCWKS